MADVITRFKLETTQYDSKLRDAAKGLSDYARVAAFAGNEFDKFTKDQVGAARALGTISTSANNAKDKVRELVNAYNQAANAYNALTKGQQQSDWGRALAESINTLKGRITEAKQELYSMNDAMKNGKFGQFGGIIDDIGHKIGISGNLTELLTSKTALLTGAIGAGTTAVVAATKAWADYNSEIAKQQQITTVTTGLKGDDADNMTSAARALSKTYQTDFRDAINAANTLMSQFGATGDEAIKLLQDGMRGMIRGDGPKLLSMIQQYAPAFRDAGVSASQLVAVIQNSEGGIFTDQNMNAIVMGIKNIRLMTKQTGEALAQLGIDGDEMTRKLNDGSMTIFDALKQVAGQLKNVDSNSQAAGQVMQAVFGRQGAMAGTNLAKAIEGLNTNLEETKRQTGEVGKAYDELYEANVRLEQALQKTFGYKGWEEMATGIKTKVVGAMADVLECIDKINMALNTNVVADYFNCMFDTATKAMGPLGDVLRMLKNINKEQDGGDVGEGAKTGGLGGVVPQNILPEVVIYGTNRKNTKTTKPTGGNKTPKTVEQLNNEEIQKLTQEYIHASEQRQAAIRDEIKVLQERNELIQALKDQAQGKGFDPTKMQQATDLTGRTPWATPEQLSKGADLTLPVTLDIQSPEEKLRGELSRLKDLLTNAFTNAEREALRKAIDDVNEQLDSISRKNEANTNNIGTEDASELVGGLNSVASGLQQMGIKLPDGVQKVLQTIQGLMTVIQGVQSVVSIINAVTTPAKITSETTNTATVAANTVAMGVLASAVSANTAMLVASSASNIVSSVVSFSHGGIVPHAASGYYVPGNHFSGDVTPIMANAGELILSRAQQGIIAGSLDGNNGGRMNIVGILRGEDLVLMVDRWGQARGKGELLFGKNL